LSLAVNIQALYNAGARYIFVEGGLLPLEDYFIMFYPCPYTGWRYEERGLIQAIVNFNNAPPSDDIIKIVFPEKELPDYISAKTPQHMNFRNSSATETIIEIMTRLLMRQRLLSGMEPFIRLFILI
jgi:hypothetical protein